MPRHLTIGDFVLALMQLITSLREGVLARLSRSGQASAGTCVPLLLRLRERPG
jgi:hypothetical protein